MDAKTIGPARREDGEQTREQLLNSAEEFFADQGFHATSIRQIVDRAGCNIAAVNYHFHGKDNLYHEIVHRRLSAFREVLLDQIRSMAPVGESSIKLTDVLTSYAQAFIEPLEEKSKNRRLFQLFSREMHDPHLSPDVLLNELVEPVEQSLAQAIAATCPDVAPHELSVCVHLFVAQLLHLLRMQIYFGPERCSRLGFVLSPVSVSEIVRFTTGGICAMKSSLEGDSEPPVMERE